MGPYTEEEAAYLGRLRDSHKSLAGDHAPLTNEQLDSAISLQRARASGGRTNMTAEERDFIARSYAAARNTGQELPPEFTGLNSIRTQQRIQTEAGQYLNPDLLHPNSTNYNGPVMGYRLVKEGNGTVTWEGKQYQAVDGEVFHYGTTSQFRIPEGGDFSQVVSSRYSGEYLKTNGLRFEPLMPADTQQSQLAWQRFMIQSYDFLYGGRPQGNLNTR